MYKLLNIGIILAILLNSGCTQTLDIPYKGPELNSLEQAANYISAKNISRKIVALKIPLQEKPFLLGAYDVRDGIATRVPEESYTELLDKLQKEASPLAPTSPSTDTPFADSPEGLRLPAERASYLTARAIAKSFGKNGIPVMPVSMAIGLSDAQSKNPPKISAKEEKELLAAINEKISVKDNDWAENRKKFYTAEEKVFFANNIIKHDVQSLSSGVQYKFIKKGTGKLPKPKDTVTVQYRGTLLDGTEFDSSYKRKKPDSFKLTEMIPGFSEAMIHVPDGSNVVIYVPAAAAYGEKGNDIIPPHAALIFEVELNGIKSSFF